MIRLIWGLKYYLLTKISPSQILEKYGIPHLKISQYFSTFSWHFPWFFKTGHLEFSRYHWVVQCNLDLVTLNLATTCDLVTIFKWPLFTLLHKNSIFSDHLRFMSFSSHFRFLFWPMKLRKYYIIVYLLFYYFSYF